MLTPQEVHIEINQGFQKVASNVYDYFQPEEIDFAYNKNEHRFISSKVKPRKDGSGAFEVDQVNVDDIKNIINFEKELQVFKDTDSRGYGMLPPDYLYLLNDSSRILSDCRSDFSVATTSYTEYVGHIEFKDTVKVDSPFYDTLTVTINDTQVFTIEDYEISEGLNSANSRFVVIHLILEVLIRKGFKVYWETYKGVYKANNFIIVSNEPLAGSILVDGETKSMIVSSSVLNIYTDTYELESPNRLTNNAAVKEVLNNNVFYKTIPKSPVSVLRQDRLFIFYSKRFIVNKLIIEYIRKPRKLSLPLNQSSELPEQSVRKVCDLTVEYLKNIVESPAYNSKVQDNMIRME